MSITSSVVFEVNGHPVESTHSSFTGRKTWIDDRMATPITPSER